MVPLLLRSLSVLLCVSGTLSLRVLSWPPANCSRQGLPCIANKSHCFDRGWLNKWDYTPSAPEAPRFSVEVRPDDAGHLQPVLLAEWKIRDDGSIRYLKATELHVLVMSTNENLCVRFSLTKTLPMRSPSGEQWSFFADMLVLDPDVTYRLSVFNIPKPELDHSSYDVGGNVRVPGCKDPRMKLTQFCVERGSLWQPNITVSQVSAVRGGSSALSVRFAPHPLCPEYIVIARCSQIDHVKRTYKTNQTTLDVTFSLDDWPLSCCQFDAEIKPLFPACGQDCDRTKATVNICPSNRTVSPTDAPAVPSYMFVTLGGVVMCVVAVAVGCVLCRRKAKTDPSPAPVPPENIHLLRKPPKVLVIYSQDHRLYRDIVLKLCAFLQAKCGTKVLVDLLDTTSVGMLGGLRWLEWQRKQLKNPSDKILVLCSRGVQAKWRAMCGQGRVVLREDVLSSTDDMLTPFLNLVVPDMHKAGMLGKYMVAYFDDISGEEDVPSVFDIAVKYKLMKHFEELFFRILDEEKYQPGRVKHIMGISGDEYFSCPFGSALKNAIQTFQVHQLENPDWFEKECMDVEEEEVMAESKQLIADMRIPPVLECVPVIRDGPPVYISDVEIQHSVHSVYVNTPELNTESQLSSVAEISPVLSPESNLYPSSLAEVFIDPLPPHSLSLDPVLIADPVLNMPTPQRQNLPCLHFDPNPAEDQEEDSLLPMSQISSQPNQGSLVPPNSWVSDFPQSSHVSAQSEEPAPADGSYSQPEEVEEVEEEVLESSGKGQSSGSDLGYISKMSSQQEPHPKDPLAALRRLQEELFQDHLRFFDEQPEEK